MKIFLTLLPLLLFSQIIFAAKTCDCKCTVKEPDGTYNVISASGKDRVAAGENLKKNLKKLKCELSPVCTGSCSM